MCPFRAARSSTSASRSPPVPYGPGRPSPGAAGWETRRAERGRRAGQKALPIIRVGARLQGAGDGDDLEGVDAVADLDVVESFDMDTALLAGPRLADVVLEPFE